VLSLYIRARSCKLLVCFSQQEAVHALAAIFHRARYALEDMAYEPPQTHKPMQEDRRQTPDQRIVSKRLPLAITSSDSTAAGAKAHAVEKSRSTRYAEESLLITVNHKPHADTYQQFAASS
jgi:hypothetical protein